MPILESPVNLIKYPVTHGFWVDESANPIYKGFYDVFAGHHPGVDFDLPEGTPIKSATPGIVVRREVHPGMGKTLAVRFGNVYSLYAHLSEFGVEIGQIIPVKHLLAYSGNTGAATTKPHLHFELRDLSKKALKDSVFEPVFGKTLERYTPEFEYVVDNTNSTKTFVFLAIRYFGAPKSAQVIRDSNPQYAHLEFDAPLPDGAAILIPSP